MYLPGPLTVRILDCGGMKDYMFGYYSEQREEVFADVDILVYVFDATSHFRDDCFFYLTFVEILKKLSPNAKIVCLLNKMDKKDPADYERLLSERLNMLVTQPYSSPTECELHGSSIWDESLNKGWSSVLRKLLPNVQRFDEAIAAFTEALEADEVILFERYTFLVITHHVRVPHPDDKRTEKLSKTMRKFRMSCNDQVTNFKQLKLQTSTFTVCIDRFTSNTYILVCVCDPEVMPDLLLFNINNVRSKFGLLDTLDPPAHRMGPR